MRVVREPQEVAAEFPDRLVIPDIILLGQGRCLPIHVLVHGYAPERVGLAVQAETLLPVHAEVSETNLRPGDILSDPQLNRIQIRIQNAVPQMRVDQGQGRYDFLILPGQRVDARRIGGDHPAFGILQHGVHVSFHSRPVIPDPGADLRDHHVVRHFLLDDMQAVRPVFLRGKEHVVIDQQPHGIVEAAVLVEIRADGDHLDIFRVVAHHFHQPAVRKRDDEGRITALVGLQERPVKVHFRRLGRAFEEQVGVFPGWNLYVPSVMGLAAVIFLRRPVLSVVRMRYGYRYPLLSVLGELPVGQIGLRCAGGAQEGRQAQYRSSHAVAFLRWSQWSLSHSRTGRS